MTITASQVAELREKTGLGMMECKNALVEADGNEAKAMDVLKKKGLAKVAKRADRETNHGIIESYVHANGKVGVMVEVLAETDFVAKNDEFKEFAHDVALQIAAMKPTYIQPSEIPAEELAKEKEAYSAEMASSGKPADIIAKIVEGKLGKYYSEICLLNQPFVKDDSKTIEDLLNDLIAKIGEKIVVARFCRFEIGE